MKFNESSEFRPQGTKVDPDRLILGRKDYQDEKHLVTGHELVSAHKRLGKDNPAGVPDSYFSRRAEVMVSRLKHLQRTKQGTLIVKEYVQSGYLVEGFDTLVSNYLSDIGIDIKGRSANDAFIEAINKDPQLHEQLELLSNIAEGNIMMIERLAEESSPKFLDGIKDFKVDLNKYLAKLGLVSYEVDRVTVKLDNLKIKIADSMYDSLESTQGLYKSGSNEVYISSLLLVDGKEDEFKSVLYHELLHAVSGLTVYDDGMGIQDDIRHGLTYGKSFEVNKRFEWLNEAVTEELVGYLLGDDEKIDEEFFINLNSLLKNKKNTPNNSGTHQNIFGNGVYKDEREALDDMILEGVPFELFVKAYFEDYIPNKDGFGNPHWKALQKEITRICGSGYLVKVDRDKFDGK